MASFGTGLLLIAVLYYLAEIFTSAGLVMMSFALTVVWVSSLLYLLVQGRSLRGTIAMPITIAEKGKEFHTEITLHHGKRLGYRRLRMLVLYKNTLEKKYQKKIVTAEHVPAGESSFQYSLTVNAPGNYEFVLKRLWAYDLLGLFCLSKKENSTANALVLPEFHEVPLRIGEGVRNFYMDADVYDELRPGYDPAETFGVREFRDGDKLPNVHWKLSAKADELMVRENSLPKACPIIMFLNFGEKDADIAPEQAASLSFSLMDAGVGHFAVWRSRESGDLVRAGVYDEESFYRFLTTMMMDKCAESYEGIRERYYEKYRGERGLYEILFEDGKVTCGGEEISLDSQSELILN